MIVSGEHFVGRGDGTKIVDQPLTLKSLSMAHSENVVENRNFGPPLIDATPFRGTC